jgi:hypothetical protein
MDAPSEISKRLVNGFHDQAAGDSAKPDQIDSKTVEQVLLNLDGPALSALLTWIARTTPEDREEIRSLIPRLTDEELEKLVVMSPSDLEAFLHVTREAHNPPKESHPSQLSQAIAGELARANQNIDQQIALRRMRRQS